MKLEQAVIFQSPNHYKMTGLPEHWNGKDDSKIREAINQNCGWMDVYNQIKRGYRKGVPGFAAPGITFTLPGAAVVYVYE